jgi:hypothetical protein
MYTLSIDLHQHAREKIRLLVIVALQPGSTSSSMASMIFPLSNTRSLQYLATRCNLLFFRSLRVVHDFGVETATLFTGSSLLRGFKIRSRSSLA